MCSLMPAGGRLTCLENRSGVNGCSGGPTCWHACFSSTTSNTSSTGAAVVVKRNQSNYARNLSRVLIYLDDPHTRGVDLKNPRLHDSPRHNWRWRHTRQARAGVHANAGAHPGPGGATNSWLPLRDLFPVSQSAECHEEEAVPVAFGVLLRPAHMK